MSRIIRGNQLDPKLSKESAFIEGKAAGREEGRAEVGAMLLAAQRTLQAQQQERQQLATELAIELAAQIVGEVARRPETAALIAQKALSSAGSSALAIRVHPTQSQRIEEAIGSTYKIILDDSLQPGDCIIETQWGRLDARLSTQLAKYAEALQSLKE